MQRMDSGNQNGSFSPVLMLAFAGDKVMLINTHWLLRNIMQSSNFLKMFLIKVVFESEKVLNKMILIKQIFCGVVFQF